MEPTKPICHTCHAVTLGMCSHLPCGHEWLRVCRDHRWPPFDCPILPQRVLRPQKEVVGQILRFPGGEVNSATDFNPGNPDEGFSLTAVVPTAATDTTGKKCACQLRTTSPKRL